MKPLVVVERPERWGFDLAGAEVVSARAYLTDPAFGERGGLAVFNLCRGYGYQRLGYYVSLLAAARGHRPIPSVATLQDFRLSPVVRVVDEDLQELVQRSLKALSSDRFELSIYFGRNLARRYDRLSRALFDRFPAPLLRASFERESRRKSARWHLRGLGLLAASEVPEAHRDFVVEQAGRHFAASGRGGGRRRPRPHSLALLVDEDEASPPSDERALRRFERAAQAEGFDVRRITAADRARVAEHDALFIRATTAVDHFTYRIARRAAAEGMVVIDDPESIIRCTNKVFQAETFARHRVPMPRTLLVHRGNADRVADELGLPCVLKRPDSSFSQGVVRADDEAALAAHLDDFLERSELVVAQEFLPTRYDWRVGLLDGRPLWACRYFMASGHWQIIDSRAGGWKEGKVETMPVDQVPSRVLRHATAAARRMGRGLYGVDLKETDRRVVVIEVNDNPSLDAGFEDRVLGAELWRAIARHFREGVERRFAPASRARP